jgi:phosphate transport system permease protein
MEKSLNWHEFVITRLIRMSGYSAILFVALIFFFLVREGIPTFAEAEFSSLFSIRWYPIEAYYGILPLLSGSLMVTLGATLVAVPFGLGTAVYISEIAPRWMREILKPLVELLGGLPSVVLGFLGILILAPSCGFCWTCPRVDGLLAFLLGIRPRRLCPGGGCRVVAVYRKRGALEPRARPFG